MNVATRAIAIANHAVSDEAFGKRVADAMTHVVDGSASNDEIEFVKGLFPENSEQLGFLNTNSVSDKGRTTITTTTTISTVACTTTTTTTTTTDFG